MSFFPLVSILLPAKNCGPYLQEAVDSVVDQTYEHFELIVIDDGTTDGSIENLDTVDPRLRIIKNDGSGIIDSLNAGADIATGAFIARMDGDDICLPQRLDRQVTLLRDNRKLGIVGAGVEIFSEDGIGRGYRLYEGWINSLVTPEDIRREIFVESPLPHPSVMMRAEVFNKLGRYRDMGWPEDYDLWLRAFEAGVAMGKVDEKLIKWRDWPNRMSKTKPRYSRKNFMRARAHFLGRTVLKNRRAIIWGAGKTGALLARFLRHEGADFAGFIDINPRKIGKLKAGKPVYPPAEAITPDVELVLVAVAARGARDEIRDYLNSAGKKEGADYYCVI